MKNKNFKDTEYSMELYFPSENFYEDNYGCSFEKIISFWKFTTYELTNDKDKDAVIFKKIQSEIRNLIKENNSNIGINLKLNAKTKYEDVIKILDVCAVEKVQVYVLKDYNVWIMTGTNSEFKKNCPSKFLN